MFAFALSMSTGQWRVGVLQNHSAAAGKQRAIVCVALLKNNECAVYHREVCSLILEFHCGFAFVSIASLVYRRVAIVLHTETNLMTNLRTLETITIEIFIQQEYILCLLFAEILDKKWMWYTGEKFYLISNFIFSLDKN